MCTDKHGHADVAPMLVCVVLIIAAGLFGAFFALYDAEVSENDSIARITCTVMSHIVQNTTCSCDDGTSDCEYRCIVANWEVEYEFQGNDINSSIGGEVPSASAGETRLNEHPVGSSSLCFLRTRSEGFTRVDWEPPENSEDLFRAMYTVCGVFALVAFVAFCVVWLRMKFDRDDLKRFSRSLQRPRPSAQTPPPLTQASVPSGKPNAALAEVSAASVSPRGEVSVPGDKTPVRDSALTPEPRSAAIAAKSGKVHAALFTQEPESATSDGVLIRHTLFMPTDTLRGANQRVAALIRTSKEFEHRGSIENDIELIYKGEELSDTYSPTSTFAEMDLLPRYPNKYTQFFMLILFETESSSREDTPSDHSADKSVSHSQRDDTDGGHGGERPVPSEHSADKSVSHSQRDGINSGHGGEGPLPSEHSTERSVSHSQRSRNDIGSGHGGERPVPTERNESHETQASHKPDCHIVMC